MPKIERVNLKTGQKPTDIDWEEFFNRAIDKLNQGLSVEDIQKDASGRVPVNISGDAQTIGGKTIDEIIGGDFPEIKKTMIDLISGGKPLVLKGGKAIINVQTANRIDLPDTTIIQPEPGTGYINRVELPSKAIYTALANTVYYLDVVPSATDYTWGTVHPQGSYVPLATVTTDANANIQNIVDTRPLKVKLLEGYEGQVSSSEEKFEPVTGHKHTGQPGDAPPIPTEGLAPNAVTTEKLRDGAVTPAKAPQLLNVADMFKDFIAWGLLPATGNNLQTTIPGGVAYLNSQRLVVPADTIKTFTARKHTYTDLKPDGTFAFTEVESEGLIHDCETAWNEKVAPSVTVAVDNVDYRVGSASVKVDVLAAVVANTVLVTKAIPLTNMTVGKSVRLRIKSSVKTALGNLQLLLDDTAQCASPVHALNIPVLEPNTWTDVELFYVATTAGTDKIISIGLKYVADLGAMSINIDDVQLQLYPEEPPLVAGAIRLFKTETDALKIRSITPGPLYKSFGVSGTIDLSRDPSARFILPVGVDKWAT